MSTLKGSPRGPGEGAAFTDDPLAIAREALGAWNAYLATASERQQASFILLAHSLLAHEVQYPHGASGWPLPTSALALPAGQPQEPSLSSLTQGPALSVLARAYHLTGDATFAQAAHRAARTLELDMLDGGLGAPIGEDGIWFETTVGYPAAHGLSGGALALLALNEYARLVEDAGVAPLAQRGHAALHTLLGGIDTGYWTREDLLRMRLSPARTHALHITLMEAIGRAADCTQCLTAASRWAAYQRRWSCRLRYVLVSQLARLGRRGGTHLRRWLFWGSSDHGPRDGNYRVCVPIRAFPVAGGTRAVLSGIAQTMAGEWHIEYLTRHVGPDAGGFAIRTFGRGVATPWQFPNVWLYAVAGWRALLSLLRETPNYCLILPQDGVATGAFAALAARMAGVRVVCMDHGNVTLLKSAAYRAEQLRGLKGQPWPTQMFSRVRLALYWPTLRILAGLTTRCSDFFLAAGQDVANTYQRQLGVPVWRVDRYPFLIDAERYAPLAPASRAQLREGRAIPVAAVVVTIVCRLAPEKGLDVAVPGIVHALSSLPAHVASRVHVVIGGDGPERFAVEANVRKHGLEERCALWGELTPLEVGALLGMSDIFLYTSTRGAGTPVAVLEAMAAGCAVIAATRPASLAQILGEGRGLAIPAGDAAAVGAALSWLIANPQLRQEMGQRAREYVATQHSASALRRSLQRATYWSPQAPQRLSAASGNAPQGIAGRSAGTNEGMS